MKIKTDQREAAKAIRFGFNLMLFFSDISEPFVPETSVKIKSCLGKSQVHQKWPTLKKKFTLIFDKVKIGEEFKPLENLFKKIDDGDISNLEKQFAGTT